MFEHSDFVDSCINLESYKRNSKLAFDASDLQINVLVEIKTST
jgi:hypothetical protein